MRQLRYFCATGVPASERPSKQQKSTERAHFFVCSSVCRLFYFCCASCSRTHHSTHILFVFFFFSFKFSTQFGHEMWMQRCYANWLTAVTFRLEDVVWSVVLFHWPLKCIFHMHISGLLFRLSFWFENSSLLLSFRLPTQFHTLNGIIYCSRYDGEWSSDGINAIVTNLKKTDILSCA